MAKQTFTTGQVLTAAQVNSLQTNDFNQTVSAKTASYVLVAADKGTRIEFNTSGSVTCTVNTGLFDAGDTVYIQNTGAGVVTITAGTATVNTSASLTINQYEGGVLYFVSTSSAIWFEYASTATGDITGVTAGTGISGGGTSGTVTITNSMATEITASGDIIVGTGSGTFDNLPIGTTGQVLTADTTVSPYKVKWASASSGLVLITNTAFTTSTAVNVNNVFTSSYRNYRVIINYTASSAQTGPAFRLRASGTDNSSANYIYAGIQNFSNDTTTYTVNQNGNTSFTTGLQTNSTNGATTAALELRNPQASLYTAADIRTTGSDGSRGSGLVQVVGYFKDTTSFDGFSIIPDSGNITGRVYVYAYAE